MYGKSKMDKQDSSLAEAHICLSQGLKLKSSNCKGSAALQAAGLIQSFLIYITPKACKLCFMTA